MIQSNFPSGSVIGVKGNEETNYRMGKVNITPENIGAYSKAEIDARINTLVVDHTVYMSTLFNIADHTITFNNA